MFLYSSLMKGLDSNSYNLPPAEPLEMDTVDTPYYVIADAAFALRTWLQKPYPGVNLPHDQKIYNYRLSRARLVVECAFGILAQR